MVAIPDIRQRYSYDCGPGLVKAICKAFGKRAPKVRCSTRFGTDFGAMATAFNQVGLVAQCGEMNRRDLEHHLALGRVVAVVIPAADGSDDGHWVGVHKIANGWVSYHDPGYGPIERTIGGFLRGWTRRGRQAVAVGRR